MTPASSHSDPQTAAPRYRLTYWRSHWAEREDQVFLALSIVIGALTGLAVVALILLTERLGARLFPPHVSLLRRVLAPMVGSLFIGYLLARFFSDARGNGAVQTRIAYYSPDARISLHSVVGTFVCTSATLASGVPLGPEAPSVLIGGGLASVLGRKLGLGPEKVRSLIPVGAAAAIAAAFNTPLAGVIFSLEEIVGDLHAPLLGSTVVASATAWMVLRLSLGNEPLFHVPQYSLVSPIELAVYALLGLAAGGVSGIFSELQLWIRKQMLRLPAKSIWVQPFIGGAVVGLSGSFLPEVLGVGYDHINALLNGEMALRLAALLLLSKVLTAAASSGTGNAGGIFAPVLFIGAMLGGTFGGLAHHFFPLHTAQVGAYALVGMGALFAGVIRTPMTSVVLVFELTRDYAIIVPLMISVLVSYFISRRLVPQSLSERLTRQVGAHLPSRADKHAESTRRVVQLLRPAEPVAADMTVSAAYEMGGQSRWHSWPVIDRTGLVGVVSFGQLRNFLANGKANEPLGKLVLERDVPHVHSDHSFDLALERMGRAGLDMLPVVSRVNPRELLGSIHLEDILGAYHLTVPVGKGIDATLQPDSRLT